MKIKLFILALSFLVSDAVSAQTMFGVRTVYSTTNVTTAAWVPIIAVSPQIINGITVFDSCGKTLKIGWANVGSAAGTEANNSILIPPGGGGFGFNAPVGVRVSLIAVSGNCTAANTENDTNFFL